MKTILLCVCILLNFIVHYSNKPTIKIFFATFDYSPFQEDWFYSQQYSSELTVNYVCRARTKDDRTGQIIFNVYQPVHARESDESSLEIAQFDKDFLYLFFELKAVYVTSNKSFLLLKSKYKESESIIKNLMESKIITQDDENSYRYYTQFNIVPIIVIAKGMYKFSEAIDFTKIFKEFKEMKK